MRIKFRLRARLLPAALLLPLALGGFTFFLGASGANVLGGAIDYITSSLTSPLANAGWVIANASYCPHPVTGTLNPNSATVSSINTTGISVGDLISDNTAGGNGYIQYGTTVTAVNAGANTITLSNPVSSTTPANTVLSLLDEPQYPVQQVDWDAAHTTNQPQNALAVGGGTATATTTTGVADGSPAITGVNNVFGATAGWWVTTADLNAPVQIASISGSAPNYSITLVNGANAQINYTAQTTITLQPNEPTIVQYRNSAEGTAAAASFTGYIAGTTLTVTALSSGTICAPSVSGCAATANPPLYDASAGLAQGTYIVAQLSGASGGIGTYQVSDAQTLGSSGSPVSLQTMGTVATYHSFSGYTNSPGAFPRSPTSVTYAPGDVYEVLPAIYAGFNQALDLEPNTDGWCGNEVVTAGSDYVTCTSHAGNFTVGDFLTEYGVGVATHYVGYISGTTFTVTMVDGGISGVDRASVGEIVTGGGIASGTMITACGASGCLAPGTFTVGCMTGASGGCASQTLGSAAAPVAFTVEGNFGTDETSTVTAVYPSGNANCPAPNTDLCIQVSRTPVVTKASGEGWSTYLTKPVSTLTVEGITQTLGGNPARPEIAEDSSPTGGSGTLKAMVNIGNDAGTGTTSGLLLRNIDVESNGLANEEYLVDIHTGLIGTNTLEQMRIEGQIWATAIPNISNAGDGIISGEPLNIISNQFDPPDNIDQILDNQGTLNLEQLIIDYNGGAQGPQHNVYIGNTPRLTVNFINDWISHANYGHLIKSRAGVTNIIGSYLEGDDTLSGLYGVAFQGYLANGILTVTSVSKGKILPDVILTAAGLDAGTSITSFVAGSGTPGGAGQYNLYCASPPGYGACLGQANIGSSGSPIAFTSDYFNNGGADGTAPAESRDAEITCAGTATIENTILTKGEAGPQSQQDFIAYGEEMESHHYNATVTTGTAIGGSTLNLNSTGPIAYQFAADATNPWAFPWGTQITTTTSTSVTLATEPGTNCGGAVCMPVQPGDTILLYYDCPFTVATNKLTVKNNDFVAYRATWDGVQNHQPLTVYSTQGYDQWVLPGDPGWPFASNSDWTITDNIFAGVCSSATGIETAKDPNSGNSSLAYADFPWTGPAPSGGTNGALSLVLSPAELSQSFQQTGTVYGDSSDTSIIGTAAYLHAAAAGLTRARAVIGAVD